MRRPISLLLATLLVGSCSLTEFSHDECHVAADCRAAFGFASICRTDSERRGLCTAAGQTSPPVIPPATPPMRARCHAGYPADLFSRPVDYRDWLVMGAIMNERDPGDVAAENAIALAMQQADDLGGLGVNLGAVGDGGAPAGIRFAVVFCAGDDDSGTRTIDGLNDGDAAAADATFLAQDLGLPIILGPSTSIQAEAAYHAIFPTATSAPHPTGPVFISHSATSPALTGDDIWGLFWRTVPSDAVQGRAIAQDIMMRHVTPPGARVAEIVETGPYGDGLREAFGAAFTSGTPTVMPFDAGNATMRGSVSMAVGAMHTSYDEVLFISSSVADEPAFLTYAAMLGTYGSLDIFVTDTAASSPAFLAASGSASTLFPHVRGTRFALASGPVYMQFVAAYTSTFMGAPDVRSFQYAPGAYDAAWLAFAGASWAYHSAPDGVITGEGVSEGLRHVSGHGTPLNLLPASWSAIDAAFAMHADVNVNGVSGALDYDPMTEETTGPVEVWKIDTTTTPATIVVDHTVTP